MQITAELDKQHFEKLVTLQQELKINTAEFIAFAIDELYSKRQKQPIPKITVNDLAGCLAYQGKAKTIEEMDEGIRQGIIAEWGEC